MDKLGQRSPPGFPNPQSPSNVARLQVRRPPNYPLVRMTNLETKHVFYSRTHDHSSMGVSKGNRSSTHFDVPLAQEKGLNLLVVVANGIASAPALVIVE